MSAIRIARRTAIAALLAAGFATSGSIASAHAADCGPAADALPTTSNIQAVEDAMICLANEDRGAYSWTTSSGTRFYHATLFYSRPLQVVAEQNVNNWVRYNAPVDRPAQDRANDAGYKMGARCTDSDYRNWVKDGNDWAYSQWGAATARQAVKNMLDAGLRAYNRDTSHVINMGAGVNPRTPGGSSNGATFSIVLGKCNQG